MFTTIDLKVVPSILQIELKQEDKPSGATQCFLWVFLCDISSALLLTSWDPLPRKLIA